MKYEVDSEVLCTLLKTMIENINLYLPNKGIPLSPGNYPNAEYINDLYYLTTILKNLGWEIVPKQTNEKTS